MTINRLKNIFVIFLVCLAAFQTTQLWFDSFSNRNFFYTVFPSGNNGAAAMDSQGRTIATPYRIFVGLSDKTFTIKYNHLIDSPQKEQGDEALRLILKNGVFVSVAAPDYATIFKNRTLVYDYAFAIPSDAFAQGLGENATNLTGKIKDFTTVVLSAEKSSGRINCFFLTRENNEPVCYLYTIVKNTACTALADAIDAYSGYDSTHSLTYASSKLFGYTLFQNNVFIAQVPDTGYTYRPLMVSNPYAVSDGLFLSSVEKKIDFLFENPLSKLHDTINNVFTYRDDNTVVKYYPNNVLEYTSYWPSTSEKSASLAMDCSAAYAFLAKDKEIGNEYFLSGYEEGEGYREFCFDYAVDDLPLILPDSFRAEHDITMSHPLVVRVEYGRVFRYAKLAYVFSENPEEERVATTDFLSSANAVLGSQEGENGQAIWPTDAVLGYRIDAGKDLMLYWFMYINGKMHAQSAQQSR